MNSLGVMRALAISAKTLADVKERFPDNYMLIGDSQYAYNYWYKKYTDPFGVKTYAC